MSHWLTKNQEVVFETIEQLRDALVWHGQQVGYREGETDLCRLADSLVETGRLTARARKARAARENGKKGGRPRKEKKTVRVPQIGDIVLYYRPKYTGDATTDTETNAALVVGVQPTEPPRPVLHVFTANGGFKLVIDAEYGERPGCWHFRDERFGGLEPVETPEECTPKQKEDCCT